MATAAPVALAGGGGGQTLQIEVNQCPDDGGDCTLTTETVAPKPAPKPQVTTIQTAPVQPAEVHTYSLKTGKGTVETTSGDVEAETVKVDDSAPLAPRAPLPDVTTNGGGFPGLTLMSTDDALARFTIPPFLMPVYLQAGRAYGVPWNVLAGINSIETDFGRIRHQVSSAGALGWMQFMPGTWKSWGVDATGDGWADPYNPVDAIFAAARYLRASGGATDLQRAVYAYNHADWYVDEVLKRASIYGSLPQGLIGETGTLAYGRFPVVGKVSYGDDFREAQIARRKPRGLVIRAAPGAAAIATQDVTVSRILLTHKLAAAFKHRGALPTAKLPATPPGSPAPGPQLELPRGTLARIGQIAQLVTGKPFAYPLAKIAAALASGAPRAPLAPAPRHTHSRRLGYGETQAPGVTVIVRDAVGNRYAYGGLAKLRGGVAPGTRLRGGQTIGVLSRAKRPAMRFAVEAAAGTQVDPRPLVDGYRLEEATNLFHAVSPSGSNPFVPAVGGPNAPPIYSIGPAGLFDGHPGNVAPGLARLIETMKKRFPLIVTSTTDHSLYTTSGHISDHVRGLAVDLSGPPDVMFRAAEWIKSSGLYRQLKQGIHNPNLAVNAGQLQQPPGQYAGLVWAQHANHLHLAVEPSLSGAFVGGFAAPGLEPDAEPDVTPAQERTLSRRLNRVVNPLVTLERSPAAVRVHSGHTARPRPTRDLAMAPSAAGPRMTDISIPAGARGDEAYGIGTVDGAGQSGWARNQAVVLAQHSGRWTIVGPPRDRHGRVVNPVLRALASTAGGRGYAVGDGGAVVRLRGQRAPLLERRATNARLAAVIASSSGGRLHGLAVGTRGVALNLDGARQRAERVERGVALTALEADGADALAAGTKAGAPSLYRRTSQGWQSAGLDLRLPPGDGARITSLGLDGGTLWVAGALTDATSAAERPFAAQRTAGGWATFCEPSPALAGVVELGRRSTGSCGSPLPGAAPTGAAGELASVDAGVLLATSSGLELYSSTSFRPVRPPQSAGAGSNRGFSKLAVRSDGSGWALAADGRMAAVDPHGESRSTPTGVMEQLPWMTGGQPPAVAVAPGGGRALALGRAGAAELGQAAWRAAGGLGIDIRDAAFAGDQVWALEAQTGALMSYRDGHWTVPAASGDERDARVQLLRRMGAATVTPNGDSDAPLGLRALGFNSARRGYAVGLDGAIARFDGTRWRTESSPTHADLADVAVGAFQVVAVGKGGTLLERSAGKWQEQRAARELVGGQDFTAVSQLPDGTFVAAASGTIIQKAPGAAAWQPSGIAALGAGVTQLAGYRDSAGGLHALALLGSADAGVLMDGDGSGWAAVAANRAAQVTDFGFDPGSGTMLIVGLKDESPVALRMRVPTAGAPAAATALGDTLAGLRVGS